MLEKQDLVEVRSIVIEVVHQAEERIKADFRGELKSTTDGLRGAMRESEERIVSQINREITDLAEINRAVIAKVSVIPELEQRLLRLEQKLGIVV